MALSYDFTIDCSQDFTWDIDLERKASTSGDFEAYAGVTGVTFALSDTIGGAAIHATLEGSASERSATPGRLYGTVDVVALQTNLLPTYEGRSVWLVLEKTGEFDGKSFRCKVTRNG